MKNAAIEDINSEVIPGAVFKHDGYDFHQYARASQRRRINYFSPSSEYRRITAFYNFALSFIIAFFHPLAKYVWNLFTTLEPNTECSLKIRSNMFRTGNVISILIIITSTVLCQSGEYAQKSVSSLGSVWLKPDALLCMGEFDYRTFDKFSEQYVEVDRFDYNVLPQNLLIDFHRETDASSKITAKILTEIFEKTVATKIVDILNDPEVIQNRELAPKNPAAFQTFVTAKAKSIGLTPEELTALMNSAYFYLPFITSMDLWRKGSKLTVKIRGGMIWWSINLAADGTSTIETILAAKTEGHSTINRNATTDSTQTLKYTVFRFGTEEWSTSPVQYVQNDAMLAFAKNLGAKTREIEAFELQTQVAEASGKEYGFPLGLNDGVHLDDGFHLIEFEEDDNGSKILRKVGFIRVNKTGRYGDDPTAYTYANQLLGTQPRIGSIVQRHPRLGLDARFKLVWLWG